MELDENDPRMIAACDELLTILQGFVGNQPLTRKSVDDADAIVRHFRSLFQQKYGATFPEMVPVILPRQHQIKLVRRDMERKGIERFIVNLTIEHDDITPIELAMAISRAFPHYRRSL